MPPGAQCRGPGHVWPLSRGEDGVVGACGALATSRTRRGQRLGRHLTSLSSDAWSFMAGGDVVGHLRLFYDEQERT